MKKRSLLLLATALGLVACSEKDQAYYLNHIDEAEAKITQCRTELESASLARDEAKFKEITAETSECTLAKNALREHHRMKWEQEIAEREARKKAEMEKTKAEIQNQYGAQSWLEFTRTFTNSECVASFKGDAKCDAMKALYEEKTTPVIAEMRTKGLEALLAEKQTYCKQDKRRYSACDVWQKAVKEQAKEDFNQLSIDNLAKLEEKYCANSSFEDPEPCGAYHEVFNVKEKEFVKLLTQRYDNLKTIYNLCIDQVKAEKNWSKQMKITSGVPCSQARQARRELNLPYDNFETKMD